MLRSMRQRGFSRKPVGPTKASCSSLRSELMLRRHKIADAASLLEGGNLDEETDPLGAADRLELLG
jgi:hypothetical protein